MLIRSGAEPRLISLSGRLHALRFSLLLLSLSHYMLRSGYSGVLWRPALVDRRISVLWKTAAFDPGGAIRLVPKWPTTEEDIYTLPQDQDKGLLFLGPKWERIMKGSSALCCRIGCLHASTVGIQCLSRQVLERDNGD